MNGELLTRLIGPAVLVQVLEAVAFAMALILFVLIVFLILQKAVLERRSRAIEQASQNYGKALAEGTPPAQLAFDPRRSIDRRALARAMIVRGADIATGPLLGAPWYDELVRRLRDDVEHRNWGGRVAAFDLLRDIGTSELRPFLEEAARRERHPQAYAACLACLAKFAEDWAGLTALWNQLQKDNPLSGSFSEGLFRTAIAALIRHGSEQSASEAFGKLLAEVDPYDPLTIAVISAIGKSGLRSLMPQLAGLYARAEAPKSLRIPCVRAIGMLQSDHPLLLKALTDPDWEVQATGAKYLRGTTPAEIARLAGCLTSPAFYVRHNAACTLATLGAQGRTVLESAVGSSDAFARDISRYALRLLQYEV